MDFAGSLDTRWQRILVGIAFGIIAAAVMILLRSVLNMWAPTSGPFALVYPTVLIATLYGRWQAGLVAYVQRLNGVARLRPGVRNLKPRLN